VADFNPLAAPGYREIVRRLLGEDLELGSVTPELGLALVLESDRPEWYFYRGARLWAFQATVAANAGNVSHIEVFNPSSAANPLLVVVDGVKIHNPAAGEYTLRYNGAAAAVPIQNDVRDLRIPGLKAVSQNRIANNTVGQSGIIVDAMEVVTAGTDYTLTPDLSSALPFVLGPGDRLAVWTVAQNTALNVVMGGYERFGRPEEIQP
jgi:hypothetical protein